MIVVVVGPQNKQGTTEAKYDRIGFLGCSAKLK
jgi:hypothetical protein